MKRLSLLFLPAWALFFACTPEIEVTQQEDEDLHLGGGTTVSGVFITAFEQPAANLDALGLDLHRAGDKAFGDQFVTAPNDVNGGLGPVFNQNSCENCHVSNGRSPFPEDGGDLRGLLFRLSIPGQDANGGPLPAPGFGGQLQPRALFGKQPEARLQWQEVEEIVAFLDGSSVALKRPVFSVVDPYLPFPAEMMVSPRMAPPVIGLGLLEAIREEDITASADPADANNDGISGKPNRVWDYRNQKTVLGRFGWKAGQPNLLQQTAGAYHQDMGITSPYFPVESSHGQLQADGLSDDPEIDEATLKAATFYSQSLGVPQRRNTTDSGVIRGKKLFLELNCGACHRPKYETGDHSEYAFLSRQTIYPYTDLLLHDMGEGLADHRPDFEADGREWRTPPLWGIGLTQTVGGARARFLHDGRARTLEEAILWHDGEALRSKESYKKLSQSDRDAVIRFLESL